MTSKQLHSQVGDLGSYAVLYDLVKNVGFSSNAVVDGTLLWEEMKKRLHKAAYNVIYKNCFEHLCQDYDNNPALDLKDLPQDKVDSNGNTIRMIVQDIVCRSI